MVLTDVTNVPRKYRLHIDLEPEYSALRAAIRVQVNGEQYLRSIGCKALNLWTDGNIYPLDPLTNAPPPFRNITMLVRFIGDGHHGLLAYCRRLHSMVLAEATAKRELLATHNKAMQELEVKHQELEVKHQEESKLLHEKINELNKELKVQKTELDLRFSNFVQVTDNYVHLQHNARNMRRCIDHLTHLPLGFQSRKRSRQSMEVLSKNSGAHKRRIRATR